MAFHFNWSPLIADTDRVRHMLTSSLNKSPKPPIIVDDIVVNELNLGQTPPNLEILEIGDLAEDRFRGIFKVRYEGDAYLTLKTKVQANPLNTLLSTKPSFASPAPLAASSGLTIPLQITLSDIRLSGFVILVFNKQKGITLVFRNDPLESLKVSSTFDSIPFVRDYLQKTIEGQLRVLFVEDLPAIIHRLSLKVFTTENSKIDAQQQDEGEEGRKGAAEFITQDRSEPSQTGFADDESMLLDSQSESYANFSQKNLLRLATLAESQRTLSLFTPNIRDAVFRARTGITDVKDSLETAAQRGHKRATMSRVQTPLSGSDDPWSCAASQTSETPSVLSRPGLAQMQSAPHVHTLGSGRSRQHGARKRKNRIVNLRRREDGHDTSDIASQSSEYTGSASYSASGSPSVSADHEVIAGPETSRRQARGAEIAEREGEINTPPRSPPKRVDFHPRLPTSEGRLDSLHVPSVSKLGARPATPNNAARQADPEDPDPTTRASMYLPEKEEKDEARETRTRRSERQHLPRMRTLPDRTTTAPGLQRSASDLSISDLAPAFATSGSTSGGILEQAWLMKMATEIAKRVADEKSKRAESSWRPTDEHGDGAPPPAYVL